MASTRTHKTKNKRNQKNISPTAYLSYVKGTTNKIGSAMKNQRIETKFTSQKNINNIFVRLKTKINLESVISCAKTELNLNRSTQLKHHC